MCVTQSDMLDSDRSQMAQWGHRGLDTTNTKQLLLAYSKCNTCHARLTCTHIYDART